MKILAESEKKILEDNEHAKIFMIYLYLNEQDYLNDKSKCLATLYKGINDPMPEIAYTMPQKEIVYDSPEAIDTRTKLHIPGKVYQRSAMKAYHLFRTKPYQLLLV